MATIKEVAARAGVSSATVSHVINGTRYVSAAVQEQVQQAMEALGYRPNALAQSLRSGNTHTLGMILPDSANPFFAEIGHSIEIAAFEAGYSVILCNTENDFAKETLYMDVLTNKQVDGIIFVAIGERGDSVEKLLKMNFPVVVMDRDFPELAMDVVLADNLQGGYLATKYLISLGHTRIGCIAGQSNVTPSALRVKGYMRAMEEANLPVLRELIINGDFHPESGWQVTHHMLSMENRPTAIFSCNDLMAIGVLRAAAELGLSVPHDLSVVGYDDINLASYVIPPLTTVNQDKNEMGLAALKLLLARIEKKYVDPQRTLLPVSLVIRGSTASLVDEKRLDPLMER
ncbi:MAG: LacI family DNA-binding transcriptional regulator [Chloroflexota bacterium]